MLHAAVQAPVPQQEASSSSIQQEETVQDAVQGASSLPWGLNAFTVAAVTGSVLYAQGLWGLW